MYVENKDNIVVIYPFDEEAKPFSGRLLVSKDKDFAPEVFDRLQLNIVFHNGMSREQWEQLKEAGDKAFDLAAGNP